MKKSTITLILVVIYAFFLLLVPLIAPSFPLNPSSSALGTLFNLFFFLICILIGLYYKLEESDLSNKEVALIAIYSTFVGVARIPFAPFPGIQPCSYLIFSAGWVFGPLIGFAIAIVNVLVSNMVLGHGPWSIYQMFAWGLLGIFAGLLNRKGTKPPKTWVNLIIGFLFGFFYGFVMNIWYFILYVPEHTIGTFFLTMLSSFYTDISHAIGNVLFLGLFGNKTINILYRFKHRFLIIEKKE